MRIEYILRTEDIIADLQVFKENLIDFQNVHEFMDMDNFLYAFGDSTILIWNGNNLKNPDLEFKGSLLKFCFDFRIAIRKLINLETTIAYISGNEQGEFNFSCFLEKNEIVLEVFACERKYLFPLSLFVEVFDEFLKRVLEDVQKYYVGIEKSVYWELLCNALVLQNG